MGVYYYIVNRTLKQKVSGHYGKWGEFDFQDAVEGLIYRLKNWSHDHDIWAIGDDYSDAVKYYPKGEMSKKEMERAMDEYEEIDT